MPTAAEIVAELTKLGSESTRKVLRKHGAPGTLLGVKVGDMKPIQKRVKKDHELALALYDTGIPDAQYLAGLISDPPKMTKAQLQKWAKQATWHMVSDYTVAWVAAESRFGPEVAREWVDSPKAHIAEAGWCTWTSLVGTTPDEELDLDELADLLDRVRREVHGAPNRVKYTMMGFVIAVGCYVVPLVARAKAVAKAVGKVEIDMGDTECKVPNALEYIAKVEKMGRQGNKRKSAMC